MYKTKPNKSLPLLKGQIISPAVSLTSCHNVVMYVVHDTYIHTYIYIYNFENDFLL